ncbi:amino acid permease 4 [Striga asiatica]|uniref:Amino acid permease 4 n=1 Tax=Striga asiatica TaxID=4170 RepID=A0A5A7PAY6_STRAF|nr:amino acid permease 4 [Striga asiatica]
MAAGKTRVRIQYCDQGKKGKQTEGQTHSNEAPFGNPQPQFREKLKVTKGKGSGNQTHTNANPTVLPPNPDDVMFSQISDEDLVAAIESQTDSTMYQHMQPHKPGPTPFQQLKMSSVSAPNPLQTRINIRAPPPIIGGYTLPVFSSQPTNSKSIVIDGGQKFMDLSQNSVCVQKRKKKKQ